MVPNRDFYADKDGNLTTDASKAARQIGVKGCFLDERIAQRYGITEDLVSVDEPNAPRRVTSRNAASVLIKKAEEKEVDSQEPQEPAEAAEAKAEAKTEAKKPAAKKEKTK
jgi:topoisomerase IA-like protein